ncbi:TPA: hypothetical protein HA235_05705 [Candidatus Woesearchaeota archaeon]|uniref:Aminoglycoside phosphotransferase domain-containing protein n=1 Tax=Candidatus Falkowbacteria bacterium GW2011_GWA2_39_24 TaxID=1618634 RepID=A0A0G0NET5_9BACT|nr:MAG: hypothetical protein UT42_C0022G0004 [Candidatus Falkowbacteria bacterium GW2011_GWA2_39_24]HIH32177.1 hypothetical protein [Candidatus Woesearchaeota archaeon]HIJ13724.1 hypothetical protein [Candidatus Woesearchaeota archaeon]
MIPNQEIKEKIGEYTLDSVLGSKSILKVDTNKYVFYNRSQYSSADAIKKMSKFSLGKNILVGTDWILEEYVSFDNHKPSLYNMILLLKEIHKEKNLLGQSLVHGDFSSLNITIYNNLTYVYDNEHVHWDNIYVDLGRVLLRECNNGKDIFDVFNIYFQNIPSTKILREGLMVFCDWQHIIRKEKNRPYVDIPLLRKKKILDSRDDLDSIINAFKLIDYPNKSFL